MIVKVLETGEQKELSVTNENGKEWSQDLILNVDYKYDNDTGIHVIKGEDFRMLQEYIKHYNNYHELKTLYNLGEVKKIEKEEWDSVESRVFETFYKTEKKIVKRIVSELKKR